MSKKKKRNRPTVRAEPTRENRVSWLCSSEAFQTLTCQGYTSLANNPEVCTAVDTIAKLIASMTIYLMENTDYGDIRIKNELSRKIDINPNHNMTRSSFVYWIVKTMMLEGNGNAVVYPVTKDGILQDLIPVPPAMTSFVPDDEWGYKVIINGTEFSPDSVLHFVLNPGSYYPWKGEGYRVVLSDVANNLKQASTTAKGFMSSKWKPSIIVKVDGLTEEFANAEGRKKLLQSYIETTEAGEPWMIPSDQFEVEQVKPLTLSDLALSDFVQLDKRTVASIIGVPSFVLGVGDFKKDEWNSFINTTVMSRAQIIEQEMTKKILYNPNWFFRLNARSLYNYDLKDMATVADDQFVRGIMTGNEVRDWIGLSPLQGLNELVILENYIPRGMIGDQNKLMQNGGENT